MKRDKIIVVLLTLGFLCWIGANYYQRNQIQFSSEQWKTDSGDKVELMEVLIETDQLLGLTIQELEDLLDEPDRVWTKRVEHGITVKTMSYFITINEVARLEEYMHVDLENEIATSVYVFHKKLQ